MAEAAVFTSEDVDVRRFNAAVAARCSSALNVQDAEDVAAEMLADAVRTTTRKGSSLKAQALQNKARPRYYTDAIKRANEAAAVLERAGETDDEQEEAGRGLRLSDFRDMSADLEIRDLVARLPLQQRRAVVLCVDYQMTHDEAATAMGVTASTVREHLKKAYAALREAWRGAEDA